MRTLGMAVDGVETLDAARELLQKARMDPAAVRAQLEGTLPEDHPLTQVEAVHATALGIALRDLNDNISARSWLERATSALQPRSDDHSSAVLALAGVAALQGQFTRADALVDTLDGLDSLSAKVAFQRAAICQFRGGPADLERASAAFAAALDEFRGMGHREGEYYALNGIALVQTQSGRPGDGLKTFLDAHEIAEQLGPRLVCGSEINIGWAKVRNGEPWDAFAHIERSEQLAVELGDPFLETALVRVEALIACGLHDRAAAAAITVINRLQVQQADGEVPDLLLVLGRALHAASRQDVALATLERAHQLYGDQGRDLKAAEARLAHLTACGLTSDDRPEVAALRDAFAVEGSGHLVEAELALARIAWRDGDATALAELVTASLRRNQLDSREVLIRVFSAHANGDHHRVLELTLAHEEHRAGTDAIVGSDLRAGLSGTLAELRALSARSAHAADDPVALAELAARARRSVHGRSRAPDATTALSPLLVVVELSGDVHAAHLSDDSTSWLTPAVESRQILDALRHHRLSVAAVDASQPGQAEVTGSAELLRDWLAPLRSSKKTTLQVLALGAFENVPWNSLTDRPMLALLDDLPTDQRVRAPGNFLVAASGPNVATAEDELAQLAKGPRQSAVLINASVAQLMPLLADAEVLHLCCHGVVDRHDPLRSHLELAEGALTAADIEQLSDVPPIVVSAACRAGASVREEASAAALSLSTAWLAAGSSAVVAPTSAIPDTDATTRAMVALHTHLAAGRSAPEALAEVVRTPEHRAVAQTFVVTGRVSAPDLASVDGDRR